MRKTIFAGIGGVGAAFLGALCCVGPLLFVTLGVGAGLASTFEPLRPLFGFAMLVAFAVGFYTAYGRGETKACSDAAFGLASECEVARDRRKDKAILWIAAVVAVVLWTFPKWSIWLV